MAKNACTNQNDYLPPVGYKRVRNPGQPIHPRHVLSHHEGLYSASSLFHQHRSPSHLRFSSFHLIHSHLQLPNPNPNQLPYSYTTNSAPAVQLKDQSIPVQSAPEKSQVTGRDEQTKRFEELINKNQYKEIVELGEGMSKEELLKYLCQVVTTLDQFKGLYGYLKQRKMVPDFLAHGDMALVRKVIVETDLLETDNFGHCDSIYDAIALSLKEDRHDRVAGLFEAAQERPDWECKFDDFVGGFFVRYSPGKDSMPLKRFLTLHGEEFSEKHPATFRVVCGMLVWELRYQLDNPASQKPLIDLIGQPSLLTPTACAWGFLYCAADTEPGNLSNTVTRRPLKKG